MALNKKYANLPDVDEAPDIYETPELVEDASTVPTSASPEPSENGGDEHLDRQRLDRDSARRRFEPALVSARDANFSDTVASDERRSYKTRSRRRRLAGHDIDSNDSDSEDETINERIARLRREAEELKLEISKQKADSKGAVREQQDKEADEERDGMSELNRLLKGLRPTAGTGDHSRQEDVFLKTLSEPVSSRRIEADGDGNAEGAGTFPSTTAAIAAFSDRLTALEAALGLSAIDTANQQSSILPTLDALTRQVSTLSNTLSPKPALSGRSAPPTLPNLDLLSTRIKALTAEAEKLSSSRKAAVQSLSDLNDARIRYNATRHSRPQSRPESSQQANALQNVENQEANLHSDLFLSEQSSKITALYQILPTINSLQPLLPVVLERLRSLNVIHAGAAEARAELDEALKRQSEMKHDVARWREAVEGVEKQMVEMRTDMKQNVQVVGDMVRDVEQRVSALSTSQ